MEIPPIPGGVTITKRLCDPARVFMTAVDIYQALQDDPVTTALIATLLNQSGGTPGPVTIAAITAAFAIATAEEKGTFEGTAGIPGVDNPAPLPGTIEKMTPAEQEAAWCKMWQQIKNGAILDTKVVLDKTLLQSTLELIPEAAACYELLLTLGKDVVGVGTDQEIVTIKTCSSADLAQPTAVLTADDGVGGTVSDGVWKQTVINLLQALMNCCPSCPEVADAHFSMSLDSQLVLGPVFGTFTGTFPGFSLFKFDPLRSIHRVVFGWSIDTPEATTWFAKPDLKLICKARWIYFNGDMGPVFFVNSDLQEAMPDKPNVQGLAVWIYPSVTLSVKMYVSDSWYVELHESPNAP